MTVDRRPPGPAVEAGAPAWERAARELAAGRVVALPTDTVYGLAARIDRPAAVEHIFAMKRRPKGVALPVLVATVDQARAIATAWPEHAEALASALWPGALTIVVHADPQLAGLLGSVEDTVGFRCPAHDAFRALCSEAGPLAVTSANLHGEAPCSSAADVLQNLGRAPAVPTLVVDGGRCDGTPSTVVVCHGAEPALVRSGALSWDVITAITSAGAPPDAAPTGESRTRPGAQYTRRVRNRPGGGRS